MNLTLPRAAYEPATSRVERRFLVDAEAAERATKGRAIELIEQTYLPRSGEWSMRSRKIGATNSRYILTMKHLIAVGENAEIEQEGCAATHLQFFTQSGVLLRKTRCFIPLSSGHSLQLDIFLNEVLQGLAIAEVGLERLDEAVQLPSWLGPEITGKRGYSNGSLFERLRRTTTLRVDRGC